MSKYPTPEEVVRGQMKLARAVLRADPETGQLRPWTREDLAEAVNDLGGLFDKRGKPKRVDAATIMRIEEGRQRITVNDLWVLSIALDVWPLQLLQSPAGLNEQVQVTPKPSNHLTNDEVQKWLFNDDFLSISARPEVAAAFQAMAVAGTSGDKRHLRDYLKGLYEESERQVAEAEGAHDGVDS
jgi:hypothetical protein